ncbi:MULTISPECIES: acyltransferase family protein [Chryseobacterium]|uniref:acyltransferase family protein n=1 Tax=Chryseobacterium TaxID=59732 RepID=UPI000C9E69B0|nr:acyltransferase [Chryseobacterium scophthalmum]VXC27694.1 Peptidoglycan/LPS O-acetylase OafA/YrhL, contains acyltransferase and SGNH-hydrolase domains [Chryseobacterium sp. 8AT]
MLKKLFSLSTSGNRTVGLDILRTVAILLVMISHSKIYLPEDFQNFLSFFLIDGVAVFFVLSGFLIGKIMIKVFTEETSFKQIFNFWARRWLRTLPNYYFILLILIGLEGLVNGKNITYDLFKYSFFLQNLYYPIENFFPESWSLTVEEWFYLICPLLFFLIHFLFRKSKKTTFLVGIILIILFANIVRIYYYFDLGAKNYFIYDRYFVRQVITRIDAIIYGVLAAWIYVYYPNVFNKYRNINFIIGCIALLLIHNLESLYQPFQYLLSFTLASIAIMITLPFLNSIKNIKFKSLQNIIIHISLISYSMYLINLSLVNFWILPLFKIRTDIINFFLFWSITIIISTILYKRLELPFLTFRDKILK